MNLRPVAWPAVAPIALEEEGVTTDAAPSVDVFFALEPDAPRELVAAWLAQLRGSGISADTDYAGRSLKGQLTQARRLGAAVIVVVDPRRATIRRPGSADEDVSHDELPARLSL